MRSGNPVLSDSTFLDLSSGRVVSGGSNAMTLNGTVNKTGVLLLLSVLTAVLMPMTLVTGVFGMNTGGLPFSTGDHAFWWVMLMVLAAGVGTAAYLFVKRLL